MRGQVLRFLGSGGCATATDALLYAAFVHGRLAPPIANIASYSISAVVAFLLHRHWTFASAGGPAGRQAVRFALLVLFGMTVSTAVVWTLTPLFGPFIAKIGAIGITVTLNFCISRWLVFAPRRLPLEDRIFAQVRR
ncbi:GtrA family protein [Flavisphingomonas formosensis]|uniref:GtrA family protein n=1 Tax=Flavisphingomonas formosensis TaxID=861534 RepID=UPI001E3AE6E7|nr:GtrA family protein [Sphingomonas formosensis]